jgi:hypothetical protein
MLFLSDDRPDGAREEFSYPRTIAFGKIVKKN